MSVQENKQKAVYQPRLSSSAWTKMRQTALALTFRGKAFAASFWTGITVKVEDRRTKQQKAILSNVNGMVREVELMAVMNPS